MNQALDAGDIEGYQKLSKVSESLRKSAKFTAAQNKEQKTPNSVVEKRQQKKTSSQKPQTGKNTK